MEGYTFGLRGRSKLLSSFLLVAVVSLAASTKTTANKVSAVRFWSLGDMTRVAIDVTAEFKFRSERLTNPERLFFDIEGAKPEVEKTLQTIAVGDGILKQIRIAETKPGVTRVVLDLDQHVEFTASQLTSPDRLMIELHGTARPAPMTGKVIEEAPIPAAPPSVTHPIVLSESIPATVTPAAVTPSKPKKPEPRRFEPPPHVETVSAEIQAAPIPPELPAPPSLPLMTKLTRPPGMAFSLAKNEIPGPPKPPEVTIATPVPFVGPLELKSEKTTPNFAIEPAKRPTTGERSLTRVLGLKLGRVVIDPGHGGKDVGTHGPSGLYEKDVVLDVSRRLGALIEDRLGSEVVYTRSDDTFIQLEERTRIANDRKADLFLSIHANSSPLRSAAGVEMYYLNFTTSKAALDIATRENASSGSSIHDLKNLLEKIALRDKIDESREFAARLQTSLSTLETKGNSGAKNRGLKKAPFIVLIGASMPSVLAEIGFLTNAGDEALLRKPEYRQKIADALYRGIASYAETLSHFQVAQKHD
jgi:N-acetylmuramoyl-L-alanine amidase